MNLVRIHPRTPAPTSLVEPFSLMRNLLRWDPFRDGDLGLEARSTFFPSFDVRETAESYVFQADLPGFAQENLDIQLTGNRLTLSGSRTLPAPQEKETYFIRERVDGSFCRTFNLPEGVDGNAISAELKHGVLNLVIPKVPEVQPRKITIS